MLFAVSCMDMYSDVADGFGDAKEVYVETIAGSYPTVVNGFIDSTGTAAQFNEPFDIATDGVNLYIVDTSNNRIRKMVISTGVVTTIAGSGASTFLDGTGTAATFNNPRGITTDGTNLYVSDSYNHAIRKVVISTGAVTTIAGAYPTATSGLLDGIGTAARFNIPRGIVYSNSCLYVVEINNHSIRKIVLSSGAVTTIAGSYPTATGGFIDGTGTASRFESPIGIASDGSNLYVSDTNNHAIRKIVLSSGVVTTIAGSYPTPSFGLLDGIGTSARFNQPTYCTYSNGFLFLCEGPSHAVRQIEISCMKVTTIAGSYPTVINGFIDGASYVSRFNYPRGITTDGTNLYVADTLNSAIRKIYKK